MGPGETAPHRIEIVLADDHAMIRSGLRRVLDAEADLSVVAEAADVESALLETRRHRPQVVVLDLNMPGRPTLAAIPQFLDAAPGSSIVVLTMEHEPGFARRALSAGARGYVLKDAADTELIDAVHSVAAGRTYLAPSLGAQLATADPDPEARLAGPSGEPPRLAVGSNFAGHRIDAVLGRGAMGAVFRATDYVLERTVALKVITPDRARDSVFRARFRRECRLAAAIDHSHVVEVFHAGQERGLLYLSMRYVDGSDLGETLAAEGRLEPTRAVSIVAQIAGALDAAHALGLVHRDVKPENILLATVSSREHAYLTDFGIARHALEEHLTGTGVALGTVDYVAPEQARGAEVDGRADVYSLGCVLFQMLSGTVPFARDNPLEKLWAHVHDPPPKLVSVAPGLPTGLEDVLDRALAKDPAHRQQSAGALARDALDALGDVTLTPAVAEQRPQHLDHPAALCGRVHIPDHAAVQLARGLLDQPEQRLIFTPREHRRKSLGRHGGNRLVLKGRHRLTPQR
ncbi:MAG TPA: protein kinase [Solirubrobacteraceae bacterium]|nr:protein kinase [Solirubrobacteraceae bacterium]